MSTHTNTKYMHVFDVCPTCSWLSVGKCTHFCNKLLFINSPVCTCLNLLKCKTDAF